MLFVLYTIALLVLAFLSAFFVAAFVNLALKTPPLRYVISSPLIAVASFLLVFMIGTIALRPLRWFNGEPQDWRTALSDWIEIISVVVSILCFSAWQFLIRKRRKLHEVN